MANSEQLAILRQGVVAWNAWRAKHGDVAAALSGANLREAHLEGANLGGANLEYSILYGANLGGANLSGARLYAAYMTAADLSRANLYGVDLHDATLDWANLYGVDLSRANLSGVNLSRANLREAHLMEANLSRANLYAAKLRRANLSRANLQHAILVETDFTQATLSDCLVYGISAWSLRLASATQTNLAINAPDEPLITVDNLEVAQFLHLMLHNQKIRDIIDTLTSKVVLILGRFTPERKAILDSLREALRQRNYIPVLFDFEGPSGRDFTETVTLLARMARFIIADLTDPGSIPLELQAVVPDVAVPVQPVIASGWKPFAMFADLRRKYPWMLPTHEYMSLEDLLATMQERVIAPAEAKVAELRTAR
jgi:uncharacterized protein YjbI with pentapeptide repeats